MRGLFLVVPALLLGATSAAAQQTQPPVAPSSSVKEQNSETVIVTAPNRKEASALSRAITPGVTSDQPLARFNDPVCFLTSGLDHALLEIIADRMAADAEQAGLELAGARCHPNIAVLFVDGIDAQLKQLERARSSVFGDRSPSEIRDIARQPGPVRAWNNTEIRSRDGDRIGPNGVLHVPIASRIVSAIRKDMLASVVLVERSAVLGKTPNQIADYVAMRALAAIRPQGAKGGNTILSLFDAGASPPAEMTAFDHGYLRGLYSGAPNQFPYMQHGMIVRAILKAEKSAANAPHQ